LAAVEAVAAAELEKVSLLAVAEQVVVEVVMPKLQAEQVVRRVLRVPMLI
jgi:hypothetical protein